MTTDVAVPLPAMGIPQFFLADIVTSLNFFSGSTAAGIEKPGKDRQDWTAMTRRLGKKLGRDWQDMTARIGMPKKNSQDMTISGKIAQF